MGFGQTVDGVDAHVTDRSWMRICISECNLSSLHGKETMTTPGDSSNHAGPSTLELLAEVPGHNDRVWSAAWHPHRALLASCSTDKQVRLYSYTFLSSHASTTPTANRRLRVDFATSIPTAHRRTLRSLAWHPQGSALAVASFDSTASIWEPVSSLERTAEDSDMRDQWESEREADHLVNGDTLGEWECSMPLEGHESEVKCVAWSSSGNMLATCSRDKSVWVWEVLGDGEIEVLAVLMDHEQDVKMVTWHPKEELLASASYDDTIILSAEDASHDGDFGVVHRLKGHQSTVWSVAFSPQGEHLASCSDDLTVRIWAREKRQEGGVEGRDGGRSGGWRIGRSERERWICSTVISNLHDRTIYCLDWTTRDNDQEASDRSIPMGRIATVGGDGTLNVLSIDQSASVSGLDSISPTIEYNIIARATNAHGVNDINHVAFCKVRPRPGRSDNPSLDDGNDEDEASNRGPMMGEEDARASRQLIATAGDDHFVRIWRLQSHELETE